MSSLEALLVGEIELTNEGELLWRQLTRSLWDEDRRVPGMLACGPQAADNRKPSFSRSSKVSAQESRDWHQQNASSRSFAVWAVTVGDVQAAKLRAVDDADAPEVPGEPVRAPGHAYVDYRGLTKPEMKDAKANLLRAMLAHEEQPTMEIPFQGGSVT